MVEVSKEYEELKMQRDARNERMVEVTKIAINNTLQKYVGEMVTYQAMNTIKHEVEYTMTELHRRFQHQGLLSFAAKYNVFSINVDPGYVIDVKFNYEKLEVNLIETDWRT